VLQQVMDRRYSFSLVLILQLSQTWNTREKADYSTLYVSAIIFNGFPAIKSLGSFHASFFLAPDQCTILEVCTAKLRAHRQAVRSWQFEFVSWGLKIRFKR
jgi:hypothetical protein